MESVANFNVYSDPYSILKYEFSKTFDKNNLLEIHHSYTLNFSVTKIIQLLREKLDEDFKTRISPTYSISFYFELFNSNEEKVALIIVSPNKSKGLDDSSLDSYGMSIISEESLSKKLSQILDSLFSQYKMASVTWWWVRKGESQQTTIVLEPSKPIFKEFYPWMTVEPEEYMQKYLNSSASILLLFGSCGTGKTSWIRYFLNKFSLNATITCENSLLYSDDMFIDFLTGESNILIIEDADTLLDSREKSNNEAMARFLSVSDGLVTFNNKKVIFTSNIETTRDIDSALIRPGRCFDLQHFRALTEEEARLAAKRANLPTPSAGSKTLAQLFNPEQNSSVQRIVGF